MTSSPTSTRIFLSPPHATGSELEYIEEAINTNWIAPAGPHIASFEEEFCQYLGMPHAVALSSGTAALHLAIHLLGIQPGDNVYCSTLTFAASAAPILYERATPVFIDSEATSWNMDPNALADALVAAKQADRLPRAVIVVDLYGQCANYDLLQPLCDAYGVPLIEDAAEALGSRWNGLRAGTHGRCGVFSFNGNKIITTSGGGMLVSEDATLIETARILSQQAKDPAPHYQHSRLGFNYRISNLLAGVGRAQLGMLDARVAARRSNFEFYRQALSEESGIRFMPEPAQSYSTRWLTCILVDKNVFGADREDVRQQLERCNIESRPVWKPLHLQPLFSGCRIVGGEVSETIFENGLCLPSGSNLTQADLARVADAVRSTPRA